VVIPSALPSLVSGNPCRRGGVEINLGEEGMVCHEEGAMMYWIENASQLKHYSFELWGMNSDVGGRCPALALPRGLRARLVGCSLVDLECLGLLRNLGWPLTLGGAWAWYPSSCCPQCMQARTDDTWCCSVLAFKLRPLTTHCLPPRLLLRLGLLLP
jgi:hypothetical protein